MPSGATDKLIHRWAPRLAAVVLGLFLFVLDAHHLLVIGARDEDDAGFGREDVTERLLLRCPASTLVVPRLAAHG